MDYAKFQESPLPVGSAHLRINHIEVNYPFGAVPMMTLSIERRTVLGDGTTFGAQLDSIQIALEGKMAQFEVLDRISGNVKQDAKPLSVGDLADVMFSAGRFGLQARDAVITAQKDAEAAQALADKLREDPIDGGMGHD